MPPRARWPRSAPARRAADTALVNAVLAVIDRIGELVQALETGEIAGQRGRRAADRRARRNVPPRPRPPEAAAAPEPEARKAVRSIRLSVDLLDRMMSGVSDAVLARNELARRLRDAPRDVAVEAAFERVSACIAEIRDGITRTRMQRIDSLFAGLPRHGPRPCRRARQAGPARGRRRRRRARPRDDRDDPRSADPYRPQRDRPRHRDARGARRRRQARPPACSGSRRARPATRS